MAMSVRRRAVSADPAAATATPWASLSKMAASMDVRHDRAARRKQPQDSLRSGAAAGVGGAADRFSKL
jgi:hypothetical protein